MGMAKVRGRRVRRRYHHRTGLQSRNSRYRLVRRQNQAADLARKCARHGVRQGHAEREEPRQGCGENVQEVPSRLGKELKQAFYTESSGESAQEIRARGLRKLHETKRLNS